eukprot:816115-Alexandrium_andersonii.AAC.1
MGQWHGGPEGERLGGPMVSEAYRGAEFGNPSRAPGHPSPDPALPPGAVGSSVRPCDGWSD